VRLQLKGIMRRLNLSLALRKFLFSILLFWSSATALGQGSDTLYKKENLRRTEIELAFSYYGQHGDHSAITGGTGTEKLTVYAPNLKFRHAFNEKHSFYFNGGADFLTSASMDNIDHVVSSPSLHDTRGYASLGYSYHFRGRDLTLSGDAGFSLESAYLSYPVNLGLDYTEPSGMRSYQFSVQAFFDDLRWGRLSPDWRRPVRLVYPVELRYREWFDTYRRTSWNFRFGFTQVLGKRTLLGIFPEIDYQYGVLATPYHRVYFTDSTERVENLPSRRVKFPVGIQLNQFIGGRVILKGNYQFYADSYGITGQAFRLETAVKITPVLVITPQYRFYTQQGCRYFSPYRQSDPSQEYYTCDYDLATFHSHDIGLLLSWIPGKYLGRMLALGEISLQYNYFRRSDGLSAQYLTLWINVNSQKNKRK
jgi:hypothetical protein